MRPQTKQRRCQRPRRATLVLPQRLVTEMAPERYFPKEEVMPRSVPTSMTSRGGGRELGLSAGDWVAVYAAGVGTASLIWQAISRRQETRPRVRLSRPKIENRPLIFTGDSREDDRVWDMLTVDVVNVGQVRITIDSVQVERPVPYHARFVPLTTN